MAYGLVQVAIDIRNRMDERALDKGVVPVLPKPTHKHQSEGPNAPENVFCVIPAIGGQ